MDDSVGVGYGSGGGLGGEGRGGQLGNCNGINSKIFLKNKK